MITILLAEDHEWVRLELSSALSAHKGWSVCAASNGWEAVLMSSEVHPDVVVLDVNMPVMDGLRATKTIRELFPFVPIILFTLHESPSVVLEGKKAGATAIVSKAQGVHVLMKSIEQLLWHAHQQNNRLSEPTPIKPADSEPES